MSWILFTIIGITFWSFANIVDKHIIDKRLKNAVLAAVLFEFVSLFPAFWIFLAYGLPKPGPLLLLAFSAGLLKIASTWLYFKGLKVEEPSRVVALYNLSPLVVPVFAFIFLGEVLGPEKYLGIMLLVSGAVLISMKGVSGFSLSKAFMPIMASMLLWVMYYIVIKSAVDSIGFFQTFALSAIGSTAFSIPFIIFYKKEAGNAIHSKKLSLLLIFSKSLGFAGLAFIMLALSSGYVSLVSALESIQPLVVLLFSYLLGRMRPELLEEGVGRKEMGLKLASIFLMIAGTFLIS
ncbi:MAG: EamA family transporter [Candidatus Aenigmarchaeota archaeon]|nr:EamA family transporter [Candidatus Aenigmarchaeota archaeon]